MPYVYNRKQMSLLIAFIVAGGMVLGYLQPPPVPEAPFPNLRQQFPEYYKVISADDTSRDRCIVQQGNKLSAFRDDYVKAGVMVCDVATDVERRNAEERRERIEAAQRRPR